MPESVVSASVFLPAEGRSRDLLTLLAELQRAVRAEPGCLDHVVHRAVAPGDRAVLVIQSFESADAFRAHREHMAAIGAPARIAALIATPLTPPELFTPVERGSEAG